MGLDNIPGIYPCKREGTAVYSDNEQISCDKTIEVGGCPYHNEKSKDPIVSGINGVTGIVGVDCWYRGKYGNYLLYLMSKYNPPMDFYGLGLTNELGEEGISEEDCLALSNWMKDHIEAFAKEVELAIESGSISVSENDSKQEVAQQMIRDWIYASWWLWFVSEFAEGSAIWY